jgi:RNA recognition motif-containing protein
MRIYVHNIPVTATEDALRHLFVSYGPVEHVEIVRHDDTPHPCSWAYVAMPDAAAQTAIARVNGTALDGHRLAVAKAYQQQDRSAPRRDARRLRQ